MRKFARARALVICLGGLAAAIGLIFALSAGCSSVVPWQKHIMCSRERPGEPGKRIVSERTAIAVPCPPDKPGPGMSELDSRLEARKAWARAKDQLVPLYYGTVGPGARLPSFAGEELWIISRPATAAVQPGDDSPGTGSMLAKLPTEEKEVPVPLKHTDVKAAISGYIATVEVTQRFHNPYSVKIEAVYVFPLPQNSAVNEFVMTVGERRIRGIIRERQEAEKIYYEARQQGYVASLMTQERPNIFTQRVANIEPGKQIDVNVLYFNTLAYVDGWYEFRFPMVVGPRFNPPGSTEGVGAVGRGGHGISGQKTEVQYLKPGERSGHDIALSVDIDAGVGIEELKSVNHAVARSQPAAEKASVKLSQLDSLPNKDFVLRYRVAGKTLKSAIMAHRDKRGGFFTLMLYPPADLANAQRAPMEMIFVLDCSGSMNGQPVAQAKKAVERALRSLRPDDTFQLIRFSNSASQLGREPLEATPENVRTALRYLASLEGEGGTMMIEGIRAALNYSHEARRLRYIAFLTDGYIGNEAQILAEVQKNLGHSRIFSFGVGSSPNGYLLDGLARIGKGAAAYLSLNDDGGEVMDFFFERVSHPGLTDIEVDWGGMQVADVFPKRVPDLFVGRPVILTGRFTGGERQTTVRIRGKVAGETREVAVPVSLDAAEHRGIPFVWARTRIEELSDLALDGTDREAPEQIKRLALDFGLMSAYTAFVAVDSLTKTAGDHGISVAQPVPVPDGVRYDTTVQER
ncbi:MAG: VWA domain-containing protein [Planctomycetes bacterium]|nr:VWA domain-containing protein [Planctomycetota bacterium]